MNDLDTSIEISSKDLHQKIHENKVPILVDVQKEDEFEAWNILNSINIPLWKLSESEQIPEYLKNRDIVTICPSGNKSKTAARILQDNGFSALSLHGGLRDWNTIYNPIEISINDSEIKLYQIRRLAKGCLSYLISNKGEAAIIDPGHNVRPYIDIVETNGLEIKYIFDTHLQADHVSGTRELSEHTGAELHLSNKDPFTFDFQPLKKNEEFRLGGNNIIQSIHAPGHTKGSTMYRIKDFGILSGDTVFADGIGRPDLANKSREFANDLYQTITERVITLPKNMFIAPSHHGKFVLEHFHHPITSNVKAVLDYKVLNMNKKEFIEYSVQAADSITRPPSYETIVKINSGQLFATNKEISSLEAGPNRCAIN